MKLALPLIITGALIYGGLCWFAYTFQRRFVFFPTAEVVGNPSQLQVDYEDVWIPVQNPIGQTQKIHGWWIPAIQPTLGTLLYFHGNSSNIGANLNHALRFRQMGFSVLLIDYRGYGKSEGDFPSEASVYADAEAAWQYLTRDRWIAPDQIYVYGHSLGGAIAIELVSHHPNGAGLIVDSSFTSVPDVAAADRFKRFLPVHLLLNQRFNSLEKIKTIPVPTLFIHGTADEVVPPIMSQQLFAAKPEPKQLLLVPGAGHNNVAATDLKAYVQAIHTLVMKARTPRSPSPR